MRMEKDTIITIGTRRYALTQEAEYKGIRYFNAAEVDKEDKLLKKYGVIKEVVDGEKVFAQLVTDPKERKAVFELLMQDFNNEMINDKTNIQLGQIVALNGRDFVLLDVVKYENETYLIFITKEAPVDVVVARKSVVNGELKLQNVTTLDEGINALRVFILNRQGKINWEEASKMTEEDFQD